MKADDKSSQPAAMAVVAHPDDIEFAMAGTLLHLGAVGYRLHYMTVANGSCGTTAMSRDQIVKVRSTESRAAAAVLGAAYHEPLVDDIQVYYTAELVSRLAIRSGFPSAVSKPRRVQETRRRPSRLSKGSTQGLRIPAGALK